MGQRDETRIRGIAASADATTLVVSSDRGIYRSEDGGETWVPKPGSYDLNLTGVIFPAQMPSNAPHHRSGAALYYIISGTGANTIDGQTVERGPGSLIYEPFGLVHQWGNPGNQSLTFVAFNINPEGVAAVIPGVPLKGQ